MDDSIESRWHSSVESVNGHSDTLVGSEKSIESLKQEILERLARGPVIIPGNTTLNLTVLLLEISILLPLFD